MQLLADRYAPSSLDEWMDNEPSVCELLSWMNSDSDWLIVSGESGSGKSRVVDLIATQSGVCKHTLPSNQCRSNARISQFINDVKCKPGLFVIDDFEMFFNHVDHVNMNDLIHTLGTDDFIMRKIIIIDDVYLPKLLKYLKCAQTIQFHRPSKQSLVAKCIRVMECEGIPYDERILDTFVVNSRCDVRYVLNALAMHSIADGPSTIGNSTLYDAYRTCVDPSISLSDRLRQFEFDPGSIPILCHENYLDLQLGEAEILHLSNSMSFSDVFHKETFSNSSDLSMCVYGCLSSMILARFMDVKSTCFSSPRFGLIWTKQAAKYQKMKYLHEFTKRCIQCSLDGIPELYVHHAYLAHLIDTDQPIAPLVNALRSTEAAHAYNLYNGFSFTKSHLTKKSFISKYNRLLKLD